jgi:hypothetical protein
MPTFNASTQKMLSYILNGMRVDTTELAGATYLLNGTQTELFDVYGRIMLLQLYLEITSALDANATTMQFNCTFTTPVIALNPMNAACASIASQGRGGRIVWKGGAVATNSVITDSAGLSDNICTSPQIVGGIGFIGTIGMLGAAASQAQGKFIASAHYVPMSDGAYMKAKL